jgi:GxxExxY protein
MNWLVPMGPADEPLRGRDQRHTPADRQQKDLPRMSQMYANETELNRLSEQIIGCAFTVANTLGSGFVEKVYENAMTLEMRARGISAEQQRGIVVLYNGSIIGQYAADILVEESIIIEVKATKATDPGQLAQCRNYLKATGLRLCLLINFGGPRVQVRRIVLNL